MNLESYSREKQRLCDGVCSEDRLNVLKEFFKNDINSYRRFANIKSVADLMAILEKRDLVSHDNPALLRHIAVTLNMESIINAPVPEPAQRLPVLNFNPATRTEQIHNLICSEIGQKWKDLARALDIREGQIDDLERFYPTIQLRVGEILLQYERFIANVTSFRHAFRLLNALEAIKRNDLRLRVEAILSRN